MLLLKVCVLFGLAFAFNSAHVYKLRSDEIEHDLAELLIVRTTNGTVLGTVGETIDIHKPFLAWRGIPYAKAPVGALRFRPPEPANNWRGVRDAKNDGSSCLQQSNSGNEDCLFINVYSPKLRKDGKLLPVMVWIHGGGFINGDSSYALYGPDFFLNEDVMFVSFNYRLGVFGFLSTEDLASPGNYGLKDQIFALKWIQDNIQAFGGNRNNVTIFGESAGAASVSYLVQTPLAQGLFQRAISNSGSALSQWAFSRTPKQTAEMIAKALNVDTSTSTSLVEGLRKADFQKLNNVANDVQIQRILGGNVLHGLIYSPTIEPQHQGAVLSGKFHQLVEEGKFSKVPYLMGFNSEEGAGWLNRKAFLGLPAGLFGLPYLASYDLDNRRLIPASMNVKPVDQPRVASLIRNKYFNALPIAFSQRDVESFFSDDQFARPIRESARQHAVYAPVYYYRFSYLGTDIPQDVARQQYQGVSHAEDLAYMFRQNNSVTKASFTDFRTRYQLVRMWSNFVKYGNPTPAPDALLENIRWPTTTESSNNALLTYLDIGEHLQTLVNPREGYLNDWQIWFRQYGNSPYDTY